MLHLTTLFNVLFVVVGLLLNMPAFAESAHYPFGKPIKSFVKPNKNSESKDPIPVYLMNIQLPDAEITKLASFQSLALLSNKPLISSHQLPSSAQQGMSGMPVLDQGYHGTCVTFANTAAIDAMLFHSDYISQFTFLELGEYLERSTSEPSGWDGSWGDIVLDRLVNYGVVRKYDPSEYPVHSSDTGESLSPQYYQSKSISIKAYISWRSILTYEERRHWNRDNFTPNSFRVLNQVKAILADKSRNTKITFGVLLPSALCESGACGKHNLHNTNADSWVISPSMYQQPPRHFGGHEMIITGYDDNAVALDNEGFWHRGLFTLRNSWGHKAGDNGDYYMSYDYFRLYALDVQLIERK